VAAVAAGGRIESVPMIVAMAVGVAIIPVVGQNWGAGLPERVDEARRFTNRAAVIFGAAMFIIFLGAATPIARIFTEEPQVVDYVRRYLWALMVASIGLNLAAWTSQALTAAGKSRWVLILNVGGTAALIIPLTALGARLGGFTGMMVGYAGGQLAVGYVATIVGQRHLGVAR